MSNAQTEARAIARKLQDVIEGHYWRLNIDKATDIIATALAARDAELAEAASALWRIPPNVHTIPCEANGFSEPDPFEGVGETYADAYSREKSRADRAEAQLAEARKALGLIAEGRPDNPIGDPWAFYDDLVTVARRAREAQGGQEDG